MTPYQRQDIALRDAIAALQAASLSARYRDDFEDFRFLHNAAVDLAAAFNVRFNVSLEAK